MAETTAVCPHCDAYLLEWDPVRGRLGPRPDGAPSTAEAPRAPQNRGPIFGQHAAAPTLDSHRSLTVLRWLCGIGMALHALLVLIQLVDPSLMLVAWIALWLPLDGFWRSTR